MAHIIVRTVARYPHGILASDLARELRATVQQLGDDIADLKESGELIGFAGLWMIPADFQAATPKMMEALEKLHGEFPAEGLLPAAQVAREAGFPWDGKPLDRMVSAWTAAGLVRSEPGRLALVGHRPELKDKTRALLDRAKALLDAAGIESMVMPELTSRLGVPKQTAAEIVRIGIEAGELIRLTEEAVYTDTFLSGLVARVRAELAGQNLTASAFKEWLGTSRKYAIPVLEWFDATGVTERVGEGRVVQLDETI